MVYVKVERNEEITTSLNSCYIKKVRIITHLNNSCTSSNTKLAMC